MSITTYVPTQSDAGRGYMLRGSVGGNPKIHNQRCAETRAAGPSDYDVTRRTASRKYVGWNGFSRISTPASFKNANASRLAVSPVMKMKR